MLVN
ncbi:UNVERIFIED_CONTAM: hypothetical protein GTU68_021070 [Idotea baltica]|jgi:hypothetical protein